MLEKFVQKAKVPVDEQLDTLSSLCCHQSYPLIKAIAFLDAKYAKSASGIMTRHRLRSLKQGTETIKKFLQSLQQLTKKCHTPALREVQHKEMLIVEAFISGLTSYVIRQRMLVLPNES